MSGRQHIPTLMAIYDKHFQAFKAEVRDMDLKISDKELAWALVMQQISLNAYREAIKNKTFD